MDYWLLQANARTRFIVHYYLKDFLPSHAQSTDWWITKPRKPQLNDRVFIWKAAAEPRRGEALEYYAWKDAAADAIETSSGVYALAEIISADYGSATSEASDPALARYFPAPARQGESRSGWKLEIRYRCNIVEGPLLESELASVPGLSDLFNRMKYRSFNNLPLSPPEGKLLEDLAWARVGLLDNGPDESGGADVTAEEIAKQFEAIDAASARSQPDLTTKAPLQQSLRKARDAGFRVRVLDAYERKCAVCGFGLTGPAGQPGVQAAHIYPKRMDGADDVRNGLCLCPLHHWFMDVGWFRIADDYTLVIREGVPDMDGYQTIRELGGRPIQLPKDKSDAPHPTFLQASRLPEVWFEPLAGPIS